MKQRKTVQEMIDEVTHPEKAKEQPEAPPEPPAKPAELDQDPGGGYNSNHTYPQT
jgi:hypothetical protein